jgi:hypothetical protein
MDAVPTQGLLTQIPVLGEIVPAGLFAIFVKFMYPLLLM